jgi:hypothetical protein
MSSFSCPHYDDSRDACQRIGDVCVPGRPGCVLFNNSGFAVPWQQRLDGNGTEDGSVFRALKGRSGEVGFGGSAGLSSSAQWQGCGVGVRPGCCPRGLGSVCGRWLVREAGPVGVATNGTSPRAVLARLGFPDGDGSIPDREANPQNVGQSEGQGCRVRRSRPQLHRRPEPPEGGLGGEGRAGISDR